MSPSKTLEIVHSKIKPNVEQEMLQLRPAMIQAVRDRFPALRSATLAKINGQFWVDIIVWDDLEQAQAAANEFENIPECAQMMGYIEEVISMEHATVQAEDQ